jgi:hypothetical protein
MAYTHVFIPPNHHEYTPDYDKIVIGNAWVVFTRVKLRLSAVASGRVFVLPHVGLGQVSGWTASVSGRFRVFGTSVNYTHFLNWTSLGRLIRVRGSCLLSASAYIAINPSGGLGLFGRGNYFWDMVIQYVFLRGLSGMFVRGRAFPIISSGYAASGRGGMRLFSRSRFSRTGVNYEYTPDSSRRLRFGSRSFYFYRWINHYSVIMSGGIPLLGTFGIWTNHYDTTGNALVGMVGNILIDFLNHWFASGIGKFGFVSETTYWIEIYWLGVADLGLEIVGLFGLRLRYLPVGRIKVEGECLTKLHIVFLTYAEVLIVGFVASSGSVFYFGCAYNGCYSNIAAVGFLGDYDNSVSINQCLTVRYNLKLNVAVSNSY